MNVLKQSGGAISSITGNIGVLNYMSEARWEDTSAATIRQKPYCNILSVQKPVLQYIAIYCLLVPEL